MTQRYSPANTGRRGLAAGQHEYKTVPHFVKSINGRSVVGIFSVCGNVDSTGDRVWPGSFLKTFAENRRNIRHLWQHDMDSPPVAVVVDLRELKREELPADVLAAAPDATGGAEVTREYLETPRGEEMLICLQKGAVNQMSYAYDVIKYDFEENAAADEPGVLWAMPIRNIREQRLWETSDVNWGANDATVGSKAALPLDLLFRQVQATFAALKSGARHSTADLKLLNQMHDLCVDLGATTCKGSTSAAADTETDDAKSRAAADTAAALTSLRLKLKLLNLNA